ncbi:uncharacterized protein LOC129581211 isoform X2 [Paramacrobiotus metropolitanus]|uniref:uncharacterized protein LOC129581211 isoform X2 n=1 Tax=Paramacrobiotus metropolitanus TaxID=2943436 RepID=UPI002445DDF7|nr:uncharacterized protein LOC129581211 isoform X2 [Paramacrobiotus metropolitanus]
MGYYMRHITRQKRAEKPATISATKNSDVQIIIGSLVTRSRTNSHLLPAAGVFIVRIGRSVVVYHFAGIRCCSQLLRNQQPLCLGNLGLTGIEAFTLRMPTSTGRLKWPDVIMSCGRRVLCERWTTGATSLKRVSPKAGDCPHPEERQRDWESFKTVYLRDI